MVSPLAGKTIVVTRAATQASEFVTLLEQYGATVTLCPTIEIREPENYHQLDEAIDHLYGYDWIIFTSTNGVDYFLKRLEFKGIPISELDDIRVCPIGEATAAKLHDAHIHVDLLPQVSKAEGVYNALSDFVGGQQHLEGLNILIPRAAVGRDHLPRVLESAGARVDIVASYRNVVPENLDRGKLSAMLAADTDCVAFTSSSTVRNLALLFDTHDLSEKLKGLTIACIGDVTAATAEEYGLHVDIKPSQFTVAELAREIAEYYAR